MCSTRRSWYARLLCKGSAHTVYLAVRSFGRIKFDEAKNWTRRENCTAEVNPTEAPTFHFESFGSGIGCAGSGSGRPVLPDEQPTDQTEMENRSDENFPKPEQTEPTQSPKQNEQLN